MNKIFNNGVLTVDMVMEELTTKLNGVVPYVSVSKGCIGNDTIMLLIAFEKKEKWNFGYVENTSYFRMSILANGSMEVFCSSLYKLGFHTYESRLKSRFRKTTVKNVETMVLKLVTFIEKVNLELTEN